MKRRSAVVVDGDHESAAAVAQALGRAGFQVTVADHGDEGLYAVRATLPDLVVTDLELPDVDGIEFCRQVRAVSRCYIVVVSSQDDLVDRLMSLEVGADDFMSKPFSPRELQARVRVLFRRPRTFSGIPGQARSRASIDQLTQAGGAVKASLEVDQHARLVKVDGEVVELTRTEFDLLAHLARRPGIVVGRDELLRAVWESDFVPQSTHLVDVHLANVRRKLRGRGDNDWIRTIRGVGLRFDPH